MQKIMPIGSRNEENRDEGVGAWAGTGMGWMRLGGAHCLNNTHHCEVDLGWEALDLHLTGNVIVRTQQSAFVSRKVWINMKEMPTGSV